MNKVLTGLCCFLMVAGISCSSKHYKDALTPEEALARFQLNEDFDIEIFAAEPFVKDPIAMAFDDHGNAFVVEMHDYPFPPAPGKEQGQIRMLVDSNKDGRVDKAIIFADGLSEATSILPWKGGLIVTAAPSILYMKDTTGDHVADIKEVLYTGFFKGNSEAQITGLHFNIDNWIYAANSGQEGEISADSASGGQKLSMKGADFRFRMDRGQFESESGSGQFGQTMDDWGHRFLTQNSDHIEQAIIPWRYLHRHPYMPSISVVKKISDHQELMKQLTPAPYWRAERTKRRNKTYQEQKLDRVEYADNHFTGAAGGTIYGGNAFPEKYYGNFFVTDVAGNLVHRDVLVPSDTSPVYIAKLEGAEKDKEFLASTDPWFRPVNLTIGPDGSLYVIDMYRQHIETPFAIPEDLKKEMDFMNGSEYGRIYRIVPKNRKMEKATVINFQEMKAAELLKFLSDSNQQLRLQAQRLLLERQDKSVVPAVKKIFTGNKDARARVHALYVLEGLDALDARLVKQAMKDPHPGVREAGARLSEMYPECLPLLIESTNDTNVQVVFQAALSLGNYPLKNSGASFIRLLKKYGQDRWFRTAVVSSEAGSSNKFLEMLIQQGWFAGAVLQGQTGFLKDFAFILSSRNKPNELLAFVKEISVDDINNKKQYKIAALEGLAKGYKDAGNKPNLDAGLKMVFEGILKSSTGKEETIAAQNLLRAIE